MVNPIKQKDELLNVDDEPLVEIDTESDEEEADDGSMTIELDPIDDTKVVDDEDEGDGDEEDTVDGAPSNKKEHNKFNAQARIINKQKKEIEELRKRSNVYPPQNQHIYSSPVPAVKAYDPNNPRTWTKEQWDAYADKDWQGAVDLRSKIQMEDFSASQSRVNADAAVLNASKLVVAKKHPELNDDYSEKTRVYLQVLQENPRYLTDPKGPIHAMRDMEEKLSELGYVDEAAALAERKGVKKEKDRQARVKIVSGKGKSPISKSRSVTLNKDEVEFCKHNGIDPKQYAVNKARMSKTKKGEVQL